MEKYIATSLRTDTQFVNNYKHTNEKRFSDHDRKQIAKRATLT